MEAFLLWVMWILLLLADLLMGYAGWEIVQADPDALPVAVVAWGGSILGLVVLLIIMPLGAPYV